MTPAFYIGAVDPIDALHEAVYQYGAGADPAPGWYVRHVWKDKPREILAGPFPTAVACGIWVAESTLTLHDPVVILHRERLTLGRHVRIDAFVKLECAGDVYLGDDVHLASFCHIGIGGGAVILGNGASVGSGGKLISGSAMPDPRGCSAQTLDLPTTRRRILLGDCATVYAGAIMLPGSSLGEGAVLAAGSVLLAGVHVPAYQLWAGAPAVFKKDLSHE